ncbi:hypothetical protein IFM89_006423 [Coptis chinensis]|uniref:Uncharacterized protein n=1 Tax=Coptis chinensis TaxID=261450 RepID=A0A835HTK4_9MAGN|nr:hypothetical protein IFM89_006423 [Coptis chinensis]
MAPFVSWYKRNGCESPSRWVLYHWGELRTGMGSWHENLMKATFGELKVEGFGKSNGSSCFEKAVVMRHNIGKMGKERRLEVFDMLRPEAAYKRKKPDIQLSNSIFKAFNQRDIQRLRGTFRITGRRNVCRLAAPPAPLTTGGPRAGSSAVAIPRLSSSISKTDGKIGRFRLSIAVALQRRPARLAKKAFFFFSSSTSCLHRPGRFVHTDALSETTETIRASARSSSTFSD